MVSLRRLDVSPEPDDTVSELIGKSAALRPLIAEYAQHGLSVPEDALDILAEIAKRIASLRQQEIKAEIVRKEARLEQLQTAEEKRAKLATEIAALKASLSGGQ